LGTSFGRDVRACLGPRARPTTIDRDPVHGSPCGVKLAQVATQSCVVLLAAGVHCGAQTSVGEQTLHSGGASVGPTDLRPDEHPSLSDLVWACDAHDFAACNKLLEAPSSGAPVPEEVAQRARRTARLSNEEGIQGCYGCLLQLAPARNDPAQWKKLCEGQRSYACANFGPAASPTGTTTQKPLSPSPAQSSRAN
jgi:hypothetical protein